MDMDGEPKTPLLQPLPVLAEILPQPEILKPSQPTWLASETLDVEAEDSEDDSPYSKPSNPLDSSGSLRPRPSYYFDPDYDPVTATDSKKQSSKRGGGKGIPVFEPTLAEFAQEGGFYGYVKRIEKYGMRAGVVKVIPPPEWIAELPSTAVPLEKIRMKEAIEQHLVGSQGVYRVQNVAKSRIFNPAQWKEMSELSKYAAPDILAERAKVDRSERSTKGVKPIPKRTKPRKSSATASENLDGEEIVIKKEFTPTLEDSITNSESPIASTSQIATDSLYSPNTESLPKGAKKKLSKHEKAEPTVEEWETFVKLFEDLPHGIKKEEYTNDLLREIERKYWRTLTMGEPPLYGADMKGSLFTEETKAWNVASLGDLLPRLAPPTCQIPGVVSPYLYFGMWRATFAWHVEDADLYSINYIHFGAPKFWYSVPQETSAKFERVMAGLFPTDRSKCSQFLRHKEFLASPRVLANHGIILNRVVQMPGEFILTYPKGYHSGFNLGWNCAESVNFATESWLPLGKVTKACVCIPDSVNINVEAWLQTAADHEFGPPAPPPRKRRIISPNGQSATDSEELLEPRKRSRPNAFDYQSSTSPSTSSTGTGPPKREKKIKKEIILVEEKDYACCLCPDMSLDGLVGLERSEKKAHRVCVMFTPATWIELDESGEEVVRGYEGIEQERWELKCNLCPIRFGCKVQCTKGKCSKSFHVTCALLEGSGIALDAKVMEGGVATSILSLTRAEGELMDEGMENLVEPVTPSTVAPMEGDGEISLIVLCRTHNPEFIRAENLRRANDLRMRVEAIPIGGRIKARTKLGVCEVNYLAFVAESQSITIAFDDGQRCDIKFKNILWPDSDAVRIKKEKEAAARAREGQIWIYDDDVRPTSSSSTNGNPTASVQIPLPYSNYYPASLHVSTPSSRLDVQMAAPSSLARSQLPGSFADRQTMEIPYQPHQFDYAATGATAVESDGGRLETTRLSRNPSLPIHTGPRALPMNGNGNGHNGGYIYTTNGHLDHSTELRRGHSQTFQPKNYTPHPHPHFPPTSNGPNNNTLPSISNLLQHAPSNYSFGNSPVLQRRLSTSVGSPLSSFELARIGSEEARARAGTF